jgi:hypothetical protein
MSIVLSLFFYDRSAALRTPPSGGPRSISCILLLIGIADQGSGNGLCDRIRQAGAQNRLCGAPLAKSLRSADHLALLAVIIGTRNAAKLDQREVAKRMKWPQSTYSDVETGERRLDIVEFRRLAKALGVDDVLLYQRFSRWADEQEQTSRRQPPAKE